MQRTPEDMVERWRRLGDFASLVRCRIEPVWGADGRTLCFIDGPRDRSRLVRVDLGDGTRTDLVDAQTIRKMVEADLRAILPYPDGLPFTSFSLGDEDQVVHFETEGVWFDLALDGLVLRRTPLGEVEAQERRAPRVVRQHGWDGAPPLRELPSPEGAWLLTENGPNLALRSSVDGHAVPLTRDGEEGYAWTLQGARWSPDGSQVVAGRTDLRHTPTIPVVHWLGPITEVEHVPAGALTLSLSTRELSLIDVGTGRRTPVDFGSLPAGVPAGWRADGSELLLLGRDLDRYVVSIQAADRRTGEVRELLADELRASHGTYTNGAALTWLLDHPLPDDRLLWLADRDGHVHLYLHDRGGSPLAQLTSGNFDVQSVVAMSADHQTVFLYAAPDPDRPYDRHLCRVGIDGSGFTRLTEEPGDHAVVLAPSADAFLDTHSTVSRPTRIDLRDRDGRLVTTVVEADTSGLDELGWSAPEHFTVTASDGVTPLHGVLYLPPDLDPNARYPIIDVIYQGPQIVAHPTSFLQVSQPTPDGKGVGFGQRAQALAQLGFVTFVVDGRITPGRGRAFHEPEVEPGDEPEVRDHLAALDQIAERHSFVDLDRAGVYGHSYGGYWAMRCALVGGDAYAAAVVAAPGGDSYRRGQLPPREPCLARPEPNRMSNLAIASQLEAKLFLIHGTSDLNAPLNTTMQLVDAFTRAGKDFDLLLQPGATHSVTGQAGQYLQARIARFLIRHLRPDGITADDIPLPT